MVTSGKQNAQMMCLAKALRRAAQTAQNDDLSAPLSEKRDRHVERIEIIFKAAQWLEEAAAPSPHPRGEPVAWRAERYDGQWHLTDRKELADAWANEEALYVTPLYAAPPPAGADAVRAATDQLCVVEADLNCLHAIVKQACDLLSEKTNGDAARSPAHNARLLLERAIASIPAPQPQEKPTGDQT